MAIRYKLRLRHGAAPKCAQLAPREPRDSALDLRQAALRTGERGPSERAADEDECVRRHVIMTNRQRTL
jgi:hypothetical protein